MASEPGHPTHDEPRPGSDAVSVPAMDALPAAPARPARKSVFREYAEAIVLAVLLAFAIRVFVVQAFKIPSGSMIPTLLVGDHILVSKLSYGLGFYVPYGLTSQWSDSFPGRFQAKKASIATMYFQPNCARCAAIQSAFALTCSSRTVVP